MALAGYIASNSRSPDAKPGQSCFNAQALHACFSVIDGPHPQPASPGSSLNLSKYWLFVPPAMGAMCSQASPHLVPDLDTPGTPCLCLSTGSCLGSPLGHAVTFSHSTEDPETLPLPLCTLSPSPPFLPSSPFHTFPSVLFSPFILSDLRRRVGLITLSSSWHEM